MNRSRSGPRSLDRPVGRRRHPRGACGGATDVTAPSAASRPRPAPPPSQPPPRRRAVTPAAAPADARPQRRHRRPLVRRPRRRRSARSSSRPRQTFVNDFNASQKDVYISLEIYNNNVAARHPQDPDRRRQRAGHHRTGRRRRPEPVPRPAARPRSRSSPRPSYDVTKRRPEAGRLLQARREQRHGRPAVRDLPVVHLLQQGPLRRGRAALPADQGRRPVPGQAVGHGRRPRPSA